jgi:class 3 adenylate cyclase/tetratricopeptide (TPR) repeat protein
MARCASCGHENAPGFRFCAHCGAAAVTAAREEQRKRVTVLFCDVIASTELGDRLDPETLRRVLERYFETGRRVIERHGGTLEKFIGDALMAVFGVPLLHEDDAWRATCAAVALREAMGSLNEELATVYGTRLALRIGVNTGEVVTGTAERLATGDAVNIAARLEQAAGSDEILLGAETLALVRRAVDAEPVALEVKGKRSPLTAWRLIAVRGDATRERQAGVPMVGRRAELERLVDAYELARRTRSCSLVTILGGAGVGKSRLADELIATVEGADVVRGRCVSYGEGITYWPVVPVVRQLEPRFGSLTLDERALATLRGLAGPGERMESTEEIAFAVRKLLEAAARQTPLVCMFDDIQWGEPAFLELIEQVTALSRDAPLLLCCIARDELLEHHPGWGGGHLNASTVRLEGLSTQETDTLIEHIAGASMSGSLRKQILEAAEGNPLFVEEMIGLVRDTPDRAVSVPPTIQALLTARLDQLEPAERAVLQRGAVEGRVFHRGAVQTLAPDETQLGSRLAALVRKELVRPERAQLETEDAYRFRHQLIRDAAYETLPKEARAELHERFAGWLQQRAAELVEPDELVGYHLEQAYRYRLELRPPDDHTRELGRHGGELLAASGTRALARNDVGAALKLLRRALALSPEGDPAVALRLDLSQTLFLSGEFVPATDLANDAARRAAAAGDHAGELRAQLAAARIAVQMPHDEAGGEPSAELLALAEEARPVFAAAGDEVGLTDAWVATAWAAGMIRCRWGAMLEAVEHALDHARRAGYVRWERELPVWKGTALFYGPTPVDDVLSWYEREQPQHSMALNERAVLEAMRGRFDEARALLGAADAAAAEREETLWRVGGGMAAWEVETLAGDAAAAETAARRTYELLEPLGEVGFQALAAGQLASSLYALESFDEAEHFTAAAEGLAASDDVTSNLLWRQVRAKLEARAGRHADAEQIAHEAVVLGERTDMLNWHANALVDLADVYVLAGRPEQGVAPLEQALALYERKGNLVSAAKTRAALTELRQTPLHVIERTTE